MSKSNLTAVVRVLIVLALLSFGVYPETGIWTCLVLGLLLGEVEIGILAAKRRSKLQLVHHNKVMRTLREIYSSTLVLQTQQRRAADGHD